MSKEYTKDFDNWNVKKKVINEVEISGDFYFHEREIWWCSVGVNVGAEMDGKNEHFERPVLVVRKMSKEQFFGVPLTSKNKPGMYYVPVSYGERNGSICLSQFKAFSSRRLLRKIDTLDKENFTKVKNAFATFFGGFERELKD